MAPSPITATTFRIFPSLASCLAATAIPKAAEMLFEACPQVKVSYLLSLGEGKGMMPCSLRFVQKRSLRPVSILCPYA